MNKKLLMSYFMLCLCAISLFAQQTETVDGLTYTFTVSNGGAELYNFGNVAVSPSPIGDLTLPSTLGGYPVVGLGEGAFYNSSDLTSITIPESVTHIGQYTFFQCYSLTSITIPESVKRIDQYAFYQCWGLESVICDGVLDYVGPNTFLETPWYENQPEGVVYVGKGAYWVKGVCPTNIVLEPDTLAIGYGAFRFCSGLNSITIPDGVKSVGEDAFLGTGWYDSQSNGLVYAGKVAYKFKGTCTSRVVLRTETVAISASAFSACDGLTAITIPGSVKSIGTGAFRSCASLTSVTLLNGVNYLGEKVFSDCSRLSNLTIPPSLQSIGYGALGGEDDHLVAPLHTLVFDNTNNFLLAEIPKLTLHSLSLGAAVSNISDIVLLDCPELQAISVSTNNPNYKSDNFGVLYTKDGTELIKYPPNSSRQGYVIPNGIKKIGEYAFYNTSYLREVILPDGVSVIGAEAFNWDLSLESVSCPSSLTSIGDRAFEVCPSLVTLTFGGDSPTFGSDICLWSNPVLYVPTLTSAWAASGVQLGLQIVAYSVSEPIELTVGGVSVTNALSKVFFTNVTQQVVDAALTHYTNHFSDATADQVGSLLGVADAMGLNMDVLAQGTNILLFAPQVDMQSISFQDSSQLANEFCLEATPADSISITFTVVNGITDQLTAVELLRDSVS